MNYNRIRISIPIAGWLALILLLHGFASAATYTLSGRVTDEDGNPVTGSEVKVVDSSSGTSIAITIANATGEYNLSIPEGTYNVHVIPPVGSGFTPARALDWKIIDDTVLDFILVPAGSITWSGRILDPVGNGVPGQTIGLEPVGGGGEIFDTTDASGAFSFQIGSGDYQWRIFRSGGDLSLNVPGRYNVGYGIVTLLESTIMDLQLPAKKVTVHVQDPLGNPVANVGLTTNQIPSELLDLGPISAYGSNDYPNPVFTNSNGQVNLWLFPNASYSTYTFVATPPTGSPFAAFSVEGVNVTSDKSVIIVLQFSHLPPTTTASFSPTPNEKGEYVDPVTVTLNAIATPGFIVIGTYFRVDGGAIQTYHSPFNITGDGNHVIQYWSEDNLGVIELPNTTTLLILSNRSPTVDGGGPYEVNEGDSVSIAAIGDDPDGDPLTYDWDLDNNGSFETPGQSVTFSAATLDGPSSHSIAVQVTDPRGLSSTDMTEVVVLNVAPTVSTVTAPLDPRQINTAVNVSANFTDPGVLDTHTAIWDWGDDETSGGVVSESNGSGSVTGTHAYSTPGVYTITLTVTDKDGGAGISIFQFVVIYDPSSGFVTGGGWINSPPGAYVPDPDLAGKANFGFVSKYKKGANVPTGDTEFQFQAGDLNFKSTAYDWLVVAGAKAQFKGTGTINGAGEYGFMLTAVDGQVNGGGGADKFRIKIWDKVTGDIIYDNQMGATDDVAPTTVIGGGSIVIHK